LLGQGIVFGIDQDFVKTGISGLEIIEFWLIEKQKIVVVLINFLEIFHQFKNIAADTGEL
jgi:hypothetical protein